MDYNHKECVGVLNCILTGGRAEIRVGKKDVPISFEHVMSTPIATLFEEWRDKVIFTHRDTPHHDRMIYGVQVGDVWRDNNGVVRTICYVFNNGDSFREFNRNESRVDCLVSLLYRKGLKE
jgi:hypothetical protein